jgi:hypothetical protein
LKTVQPTRLNVGWRFLRPTALTGELVPLFVLGENPPLPIGEAPLVVLVLEPGSHRLAAFLLPHYVTPGTPAVAAVRRIGASGEG